jgi:hypothetical protein
MLSSLSRSRIAIVVAMLAAVLVLGSAIVGQARERTTLFVPSQPIPIPGPDDPEVPPGGATVSCTGTPFVLFIADGPISGGSCDFAGFGRPGGNLVCDDPTTLFLRPPPEAEIDERVPLSAFVCSAPEDKGESHQHHQQPQQTAAPVTQDNEQDADSGDVDQAFDVTGGGDNSNQCPNVQGHAQTGNAQNQTDLLQYASTADDFEFDEVDSTIDTSPTNTATCDQQVNQAASAFSS